MPPCLITCIKKYQGGQVLIEWGGVCEVIMCDLTMVCSKPQEAFHRERNLAYQSKKVGSLICVDSNVGEDFD